MNITFDFRFRTDAKEFGDDLTREGFDHERFEGPRDVYAPEVYRRVRMVFDHGTADRAVGWALAHAPVQITVE